MLPDFVLIRQKNKAVPPITDVDGELRKQIDKLPLQKGELHGKRIGITAGSRGIDQIQKLIRAVCDHVRRCGGEPVVFAAMGSHGGGTAEGQRAMLTSLHVTEEVVGTKVKCCAECNCLGQTASGNDVYYNKLVDSFDGLIILNRVKPHTDFTDVTESGILKMLAIGIGNPQGCQQIHRLALEFGHGNIIRQAAALMLEKLPVLFGVMVTENWQSRLESITAVMPEDFLEKEKELLKQVKERQVKFPVRRFDALLVGEMGKNVSGTGMDTKVIGRLYVKGQKEPEYPNIGRIVVLSLTEGSHGNAIGLGLADFTTKEALDGIDHHATSLNVVSSMCPERGKIPCVLPTQREAIEAALFTQGLTEDDYKHAAMIYIRNTGALETMAVSKPLYEKIKDDPDIELIQGPEKLRFSEEGKLLSYYERFWPEGRKI